MQISLFSCNAENNRVNKSNYINNRFALDGYLKNNTSVIDPVIVIEKNNPAKYNYNYMYIEEFNRWYFITDIVSLTNTTWEIHAHVDVLYSWYADIGNMECIISKTELYNNANFYYDDGSFVVDCRDSIELKEFSGGFNENGAYILICAGGV